MTIDMTVAAPIGVALAGTVGWLGRQLLVERKEARDTEAALRAEARQERTACADQIAKLQGLISDERECRDTTVDELHRQLLALAEARRTDQLAASAAIDRLVAQLQSQGARKESP